MKVDVRRHTGAPWQGAKLRELLKYNLQSVRAYLLKEDFQQFWLFVVADHAADFLKSWCRKTMLSKIDPIKKGGKNNSRASTPDHEVV
jgi:hypothetical protein